MDDPPYVPPTPSFIEFQTYATPETTKLQKGHHTTAMHILSLCLGSMYGTADVKKLCDESVSYDTLPTFCKTLQTILDTQEFKLSTKKNVVYSIKKLLSHTPICKSFTSRIALEHTMKKDRRTDPDTAVPGHVKAKGTNTPEYKTIIKWIETIQKRSQVKSLATIRQTMYCITHILDKLHIPITHAEEYLQTLDIKELQPFSISKRHLCHILSFFKSVIQRNLTNLTCTSDTTKIAEDHDKHRIPVPDLEKIYRESVSNPRNHLIVLLLSTTGMRVGGLTNIKLEHVVKKTPDGLEILQSGRTLEKNRKWLTFPISNIVQPVLWEWIENQRPQPSNPYLFPGRGGPLTTNRVRTIIKDIAKKAGVDGPHIHPHSFRHSFAHMLLECGNSIENISKLLGHSSSNTTEVFYLKESAAEVSKRCNIPWLEESPKEKVIPDFLNCTTTKQPATDPERKQKRVRRKALLKVAQELHTISTLSSIPE